MQVVTNNLVWHFICKYFHKEGLLCELFGERGSGAPFCAHFILFLLCVIHSWFSHSASTIRCVHNSQEHLAALTRAFLSLNCWTEHIYFNAKRLVVSNVKINCDIEVIILGRHLSPGNPVFRNAFLEIDESDPYGTACQELVSQSLQLEKADARAPTVPLSSSNLIRVHI